MDRKGRAVVVCYCDAATILPSGLLYGVCFGFASTILHLHLSSPNVRPCWVAFFQSIHREMVYNAT